MKHPDEINLSGVQYLEVAPNTKLAYRQSLAPKFIM